MSKFSFTNFEAVLGATGDSKRKNLVFLARTSEAAERYEDMCQFMRELVTLIHGGTVTEAALTVEERNLLSVAYKNVIGSRRASWRTLTAESDAKLADINDTYKTQIESELSSICKDVLDLLVETLVKKDVADDEARVFYLKMTGDYYRYLAETVTDGQFENKAGDYYKQASEVAEKTLEPTHPIRLGLALNYSVCFYEILRDKSKACELAKNAFDQAISKLDKLPETDYKDATLIMQLLRDNLTLWQSAEEGGDDDDDLDP